MDLGKHGSLDPKAVSKHEAARTRRHNGAIFGREYRTEEQGPTVALSCPTCGCESYWKLFENREVMRLFFLPAATPFSSSFLQCGTCPQIRSLTPAQVRDARALNAATKDFLAGKIDADTYNATVKRYDLWPEPVGFLRKEVLANEATPPRIVAERRHGVFALKLPQ